MNQFVLFLIMFFPSFVKVILYRQIYHWTIGNNVYIGLSYIQSKNVYLHDNVNIGHFNVIRRLKKIQIGHNTRIGNFNQFFYSGPSQELFLEGSATLTISNDSIITSHHFIDVDGAIEVGNHTVIGGRDSQIWSHHWTHVDNHLEKIKLKVFIGDNVYIGSRATLLGGCEIPSRSTVAAGSVVNKKFYADTGWILIAGNPATVKKITANPSTPIVTASHSSIINVTLSDSDSNSENH